MEHTLFSHSKEETQKIAYYVASFLLVPSLLTLDGDLGAGKTQFAKGVARYLNVKESVSQKVPGLGAPLNVDGKYDVTSHEFLLGARYAF